MKRLLLLAALLGGAKGLYAQDCEAVSPPYSLDFETITTPALPECTVATTASANNWVTAAAPGNGFTSNVLQYSAATDVANAWFFTTGLELEAGKAYRITFTYGNDSESAIEKLTVAYGATATAAGMTHNINSYNAITGAEPVTISVGPVYIAESGINYFGFKANSDASQGNLYLDDISIVPWVCETVNNLTAANVTTNSATLTWDAVTGGESVQFQQVSVVAYGQDPSASSPTTGDLFKNLADLTPGTTYTASVRTFCSGTWGDWESINFTTPVCNEVATIPYILDFETATTPDVPACSLALAGETGGNWATANAPGNGFTSKTLTYVATNETADAWYFTPGFQLDAGGHYKISYTYGNNGATAENLSVALVRGPAPLWATSFFGVHNGITGGEAVNYVHGNSFSIGENGAGVYYLAFHVTSEASQGSLFIDNIKVEEWTCTAPSAITATDVTTTTATVTWVAPEDSVVMGYFYAYNTTGETPTDFVMNPGATLNLTDLEPGTTYYLFVKSFCGPVIGEWAQPVTFTTEELVGIQDVALSSLTVYPNPSHNTITISSAQQIDSAALYNVTGQQVLQTSINNTTAQLQLQQLQAGVYMLKVQAGAATKTIKVIKQ
jgi:Secretion system C-terminal sorting domain/Fibronectin type III domain